MKPIKGQTRRAVEERPEGGGKFARFFASNSGSELPASELIELRLPMTPISLPSMFAHHPRAGLLLTAGALLVCPTVFAAVATLNEIGGTVEAGNYGTQAGTTAFGKDEILGGSLPIHKIPNTVDGIYGNSNSWIGDSTNTFIGMSFGTNMLPVGRIAWGRDNTATFGDRTAGTYVIQYTTVANPSAATPDANWVTIDTLPYQFQNNAPSLVSLSRRHEWSFPTVNATGIRLITPGTDAGSFAAVDELEAYGFSASPITLSAVGGTMGANNVALASAGATPFAKDALNFFNGVSTIHTIPDINDGIYGNSDSWIGNSDSSFAGVQLSGPQTIFSFAVGRDNTGTFADRAYSNYLAQYTTVANPDASTPDSSWTTIGAFWIDPNDPLRGLRHQFDFAPIAGVTGFRVITPGDGINSGVAIDELEVYAIPEPTVLALASTVLLMGAARRRPRRS